MPRPLVLSVGGVNWVNSLLQTVSINSPKKLKLSVRHCNLLNYLNWNLESAKIDDEDVI